MFVFSDEQQQLRESVRRFLTDNANLSDVRELVESESYFDSTTYSNLLQDLGLGGVHVPEQFGGAGLTYVELCIVLEEMGRVLYSSPYFSTCVLATNAILLGGNEEQQTNLLPPLINGDKLATVALYESSSNSDLGSVTQSVDENQQVTGSFSFVTDGLSANQIIFPALDSSSRGNQVAFWIAEADSPGIQRKKQPSIDRTRELAQISLTNTPVSRLGSTSLDVVDFQLFLNLAYVALANEMVGGAQALLESSVEYSKSRVQFGRTIASMQAIKHKCADLLLEVELARSAAYVAAFSASEKSLDLTQHASIAKAAANDTYMRAAADTIQVHGGIGFTWENDTHFWFKRAKSSQVLLGTSETHRERLILDIEASYNSTEAA